VAARHQSLDDRIREGMGKKSELRVSVEGIKDVAGDTCWLRDRPHYWAEAWLPLAYAVACVEIVSENPERACMLYESLEAMIRYHRTNMGMRAWAWSPRLRRKPFVTN
jgi:hypothetical protein